MIWQTKQNEQFPQSQFTVHIYTISILFGNSATSSQ